MNIHNIYTPNQVSKVLGNLSKITIPFWTVCSLVYLAFISCNEWNEFPFCSDYRAPFNLERKLSALWDLVFYRIIRFRVTFFRQISNKIKAKQGQRLIKVNVPPKRELSYTESRVKEHVRRKGLQRGSKNWWSWILDFLKS